MSRKRRYFEAHGQSLKDVRSWQKRALEVEKARLTFKSKHVAADAYSRGSYFYGVTFHPNRKVPHYWRKSKHAVGGRPLYVPNDRTREGKKIRAEMDKLHTPTFTLTGVRDVIGGRVLHTPGFEEIGKRVIIKLREGMGTPADATPMKASQYHRLIEKQEAKNAA